MKTLISMTDFILKQSNHNFKISEVGINNIGLKIGFTSFVKCLKYAEFLKQPLTLGMFVPCDEKGNVLKQPAYFTEWENDEEFIFSIEGVGKKCVDFNEAKEKVLFKGFELMKDSRFKTIVWIKDKDIQFSININLQSNIENIISSKLELTESAIKQINL